jgi:hypothetical protein
MHKAGDKELMKCGAFNGKEICQKCKHLVNCHEHVNEITVEFEEEYSDSIA